MFYEIGNSLVNQIYKIYEELEVKDFLFMGGVSASLFLRKYIK